MTVNGEPVFVYASTNRTGIDLPSGNRIPQGRIQQAHFCAFSFRDEPVTIEVTRLSGNPLTDATVHPARWEIPVEASADRAVFHLDRPLKVVLKTEEDELQPLIILADTPDTPIPDGADVLRFGPGFHDIGLQFPVQDGQTIVVEGGAIVRGSFFKAREDGPLRNFTLRGRGIVYSGDWGYRARRAGWGRGITGWEGGLLNGRIEGVMLVDSLHWNLGYRNRDSVFENLKILSFHGNTDGLRVGANSIARDCFVMTNDDALLPEGHDFQENESALMEDCIIWHHSWGNPFKIINLGEPNESGVRNITYRNIDVLETSSEVFVSPDTGGHAFRPRQGPTENILFENIYIERGENIFNLQPPGGSVLRNITFRNLHLPVANGRIRGWNATDRIENILFDGLFVGGKRVHSIDETDIEIGPYVEGLEVR